MIGIIDVGGGMRGIFGAGVCDRLLDEGVDIPCCIGVSAGSANLISYIAGQRGRNYRFYTQYARRKDYMSLRNAVHKHSYFDLDYVYSTLTNSGGEDPLDFDAFSCSEKHFTAVATRGKDGRAWYFTNADFSRDDYAPLKASSAIPGICTPCRIGGEDFFDGGVADPVPINRALSDGCDFLAVVLTKPVDFVKKPEHFRYAYTRALRNYPAVIQALDARAVRYNDGVQAAKQLEKAGKAVILAPEKGRHMTAFTRDRGALEALYREGYAAARRVLSALR